MIPVNEPLLDGNELKYVSECVTTGWISSEGPFVQRFEEEMAESCDRQHGIAVVNGTAALQLAFEALGLVSGDEVIVPTFTIISCVSCLVRLGLKPVFVDCDPLTFNSSIDEIKAVLTTRTKAILVVHIYGLPVDMDPVLALAKKHSLKIVEDAAEMIGQTYKGKICGSFGDISIFSFYPNKHLTTGEGGMILTNNADLANKCRSLRNLSFQPPRRFIHDEFGWNYRMTNIQAALGVAQLENLSRNVDLKRQIGAAYNKSLSGIANIQLPVVKMDYADNIYWVYTVVLNDDLGVDADVVMQKLSAEKIGTRPFFWPMHEQPILHRHFPELKSLSLPHSVRIARKGFYLPSGLGMNIQNISKICEKLENVIRKL